MKASYLSEISIRKAKQVIIVSGVTQISKIPAKAWVFVIINFILVEDSNDCWKK